MGGFQHDVARQSHLAQPGLEQFLTAPFLRHDDMAKRQKRIEIDPQIRIFDGEAFMYSTHDAGPDVPYFTMHDWRIWRSRDLIDWQLAGVLHPEQTYYGKPSTACWATDAISRHGRYYLYVSMGPDDIGVVVGDHPAGPWRDPLGKALIAKGDVPTASRDPGILQDADGTSYIVFGTFDYYIARLGDDMISLAEKPRKIEVIDPTGPFGPGRTDDKPFMHRRGDTYYLSWGSFYATGTSPYGPFKTVGALFERAHVEAPFLDDSGMRGPQAPPPQYRPSDWLNYDRHGSFFDLRGQSYFACNDQSGPGQSPLFRNSVLCYVHYRPDGTIAPLSLTTAGVGRHDAVKGIAAIDYSGITGGRKDMAGPVPCIRLDRGGVLEFDRVSHLGGTLVVEVEPGGTGSRLQIEVGGRVLGQARRQADAFRLPLKPVSGENQLTIRSLDGEVALRALRMEAASRG